MWLMDGVGLINGAGLLDSSSGWSIQQIADFNGDGKSDIVWRHPDGRTAIWLMDGLTYSATGSLLGPATGWTLLP